MVTAPPKDRRLMECVGGQLGFNQSDAMLEYLAQSTAFGTRVPIMYNPHMLTAGPDHYGFSVGVPLRPESPNGFPDSGQRLQAPTNVSHNAWGHHEEIGMFSRCAMYPGGLTHLTTNISPPLPEVSCPYLYAEVCCCSIHKKSWH